MKILRVIATLNPRTGGPIEGLIRASEVMSDLGVAVEVATLDATDALPAESAALPWPLHKLGPGRFGPYCYAPKFAKWLHRNVSEFDAVIIHGNWQYHGFATSKVCRKHQIPYFIYPHGMLDPWFNHAYPLKKLKKQLYWRWGESPVLKHAQAVLFTCEEECRLARQSFAPYHVREKVIGYGTSAPTLDLEAALRRFKAAPPAWARKPYILFLGRIQEKKGIDLMVAAYAALRSKGVELPELVIAGPEQQPALAERIRRDVPQDGIHWIGSISGELKWQALAAAEALLLISHQENFGIVVAEALLAGTPALISNKVNIWREVVRGGAGLVAEDTQAGAAELLQRWSQLVPSQRQEMSRSAQALFLEAFDIRQATKRLNAFIESEIESIADGN